jgi:cytochrome c-type biogenesis protein CcsB
MRFKNTVLGMLLISSLSVAYAETTPQSSVSNATASNPAATAASAPSAPLVGEAGAGDQRKGWSFKEFRLTPVQSGGRIKPFDSLAREIVLFETGSRSFEGWEPIDLMFSWLTYPAYWQNYKFVKIGRVDVRRQLGVDEKRTYFSPAELFGNYALLQYAREMQSGGKNQAEALNGKTDTGKKESPRETELQNVFQRLGMFRDVVAGKAWTIVPQPDGKPWLSIADAGREADLVRSHFVGVVKSYQAKDEAGFDRSSTLARAAAQGEINGWTEHESHQISAEVFYNRLHPFQYAWILYLIAAILWLMAPKSSSNVVKDATRPRNWKSTLAGWATVGGFAFHTLGIALRCYIAGRPPVTNMYESIIWVCYGTVIFAAILLWIQKNSVTLIVATALATVGLIAADSAPAMMDPGLHPLMPVLRSNYWLTIHVLTITLSYSAFALTLGIANVTLWNFFKQDRARLAGDQAGAVAAQQRISGLNLLTYRAMQFGIVLVAAGTILGGVWADYSWGRFWGWDPKEVWALVVTLTYLAIVHGRMTNWIRPFAFAVTSVMGFLSVLMAWYGVNFILGVGLHSYGFASGGTGYVAGFSALQLLYVGAIALYHKAAEAKLSGGAKTSAPVSV